MHIEAIEPRFLLSNSVPSGWVDTTFGVEGRQLAGISAPLLIQPDGKILLPEFGYTNAQIYRLNAAGLLDTSFGTNGIVDVFDIQAHLYGASRFMATAIQPDGKVLVAGEGVTAPNVVDVLLARLNSDGSLDTSFGQSGFAEFPCGTDFGRFEYLGVQSNGKILVLDHANDLLCVNPDGSLDGTFGTQGKVSLPFTFSPSSLVVEDSGTILVAGSSGLVGLGDEVEQLLEFKSDGSLNLSFGYTGFVNDAQINQVAVQPDGSIVGIGSATAPNSVLVKRIHSDGSPDFEFGRNGTLTVNATPGRVLDSSAIATEPDGKVLVATTTHTGPISDGRPFHRAPCYYSVVRLTADGAIDRTFGRNGRVSGSLGLRYDTSNVTVTSAPDGSILLSSGYPTYGDPFLIRVLASPGKALAIRAGNQIKVVAGSEAQQLTVSEVDASAFAGFHEPAIQVALDGLEERFDSTGVKWIKVVLKGRSRLISATRPISETVGQIFSNR